MLQHLWLESFNTNLMESKPVVKLEKVHLPSW
jgi:hypothetical protein